MTPQRLLKLTLAHHRNSDASEEGCHRFITEEYIPKASILTWKKYFTPTPVRNVLSTTCERLQNHWTVDTHDATVEFYFRDIADLVNVSTDPDFIVLQAIEAPYISKEGVVAQLGWVETYTAGQQVVNLVDGKSQYQSYEEASSIEHTL
ncbi:hypothetical protein N7520_008260 [Penicillium odoratum]|uniref:uncharacterized protein n=1 Tax=Penicillium odoratum TaxID=1167516 RepID=UPI0025481B45|nr:uncharacterized protein N7520_008260 [Penicillium odoratum]KAJ5761104.1 hypothetical protein N7520_008260 [Penicillium odoratum]